MGNAVWAPASKGGPRWWVVQPDKPKEIANLAEGCEKLLKSNQNCISMLKITQLESTSMCYWKLLILCK